MGCTFPPHHATRSNLISHLRARTDVRAHSWPDVLAFPAICPSRGRHGYHTRKRPAASTIAECFYSPIPGAVALCHVDRTAASQASAGSGGSPAPRGTVAQRRGQEIGGEANTIALAQSREKHNKAQPSLEPHVAHTFRTRALRLPPSPRASSSCLACHSDPLLHQLRSLRRVKTVTSIGVRRCTLNAVQLSSTGCVSRIRCHR